jgi:hypothetical protein
MSTNILDLQRLPELSTLSIGPTDDSDLGSRTCTVCSVTCSVTAAEN